MHKPDAWLTLAVLALVFYLLAFTRIPADIALIGGVVLLMLGGILTPGQAMSGLSNEGMVTVGVLFVVGAGVRETGGVDCDRRAVVRPAQDAASRAVARMMVPRDGAERLHEQHAARGDADSGRQRLGASSIASPVRS